MKNNSCQTTSNIFSMLILGFKSRIRRVCHFFPNKWSITWKKNVCHKAWGNLLILDRIRAKRNCSFVTRFCICFWKMTKWVCAQKKKFKMILENMTLKVQNLTPKNFFCAFFNLEHTFFNVLQSLKFTK